MTLTQQQIPITTEILLQAKPMNDGTVEIRLSVDGYDKWTDWVKLQTAMRFTVTQDYDAKLVEGRMGT